MIHQERIEREWRQEKVAPFNELILSWNGARPSRGAFWFYLSIHRLTERGGGEWSPWLLYAVWGSEGQKSFFNQAEGAPVRVYQDTLEVLEGEWGTGFQVRILTEGDAALDQIYGLHVYTGSTPMAPILSSTPDQVEWRSITLPVLGVSQMALDHPRCADLCSPTSSAAVIRYLIQSDRVDPVEFARQSWDGGFDLFGHWVFNVAHSSAALGRDWRCWVERLSGFADIYYRLLQNTPVVVSVRGPLLGSALPYAKGHLMVITGYDAEENKVRCMDPAFPSDQTTEVFYLFEDFMAAWERRGKIAYLFEPVAIATGSFENRNPCASKG